MRDLPDITQLIDLADKEGGVLAMRCRAIAAREARTGEAPYAAIEAELAGLLGEPNGPEIWACMAVAIRQGRFDEPSSEQARLRHALWRHAALRLQENNPDFLFLADK